MASSVFLFSLLLSLTSPTTPAPSSRDEKVEQRPGPISVPIGADLQLKCQLPEVLPAGPVKWFLGKGHRRKLIYSNQQKPENHERIKRVFPESGADFTISIRNVTFEDGGMYYCVKQKRSHGSDRDWLQGGGTLVVVEDSQEASITPIAIGVSSSLLLFLLFLMVLYFYVKKKRGRRSNNARSDTNFPKQQSPKQSPGVKEIVYAELQEPSRRFPPKNARSEERSEYATVQRNSAVDRGNGLIPV